MRGLFTFCFHFAFTLLSLCLRSASSLLTFFFDIALRLFSNGFIIASSLAERNVKSVTTNKPQSVTPQKSKRPNRTLAYRGELSFFILHIFKISMYIRFYAINHSRLNFYRFIQYRFSHTSSFFFITGIFIKLFASLSAPIVINKFSSWS